MLQLLSVIISNYTTIDKALTLIIENQKKTFYYLAGESTIRLGKSPDGLYYISNARHNLQENRNMANVLDALT